MTINGVVVQELRPRTIGTVRVYEAQRVHPRRGETLASLVERLVIACFVCGTRPGAQFETSSWWVCDLHTATGRCLKGRGDAPHEHLETAACGTSRAVDRDGGR